MKRLALAAVGLLVLGADLLGDWQFFSVAANRSVPLLLSAAVRNLITTLAVVAIFRRERYAGYLLLIAAVLGLARRAAYLFPLLSSNGVMDWTLYAAGLDTGFRLLLVGVGIGYLGARHGQEDG